MKEKWLAGLVAGVTLISACGEGAAPEPGDELEVTQGDFTKAGTGKGDSSIEAIFLDFVWEGELHASSSFGVQRRIDEQLLYTVGQLNGDNSVGRLDKVELSDVQTERVEDGFRVTYRAKMPVAWGKRDQVPSRYELILPRDVSSAGLDRFTEAYNTDCVDIHAHDVDTSSMWYYYRPHAYRCELDEGDVLRLEAEVSVSEINTTGKYPEYDKVWEDDVLKVVAIFGKNEDGATSNFDAGISAYNNFTRQIKNRLSAYELETTPQEVPSSPGVQTPDITFRADLGDGKSVEVVALLVDNVRTAGLTFDRRYEELSGRADSIMYFGHSGLGANIRALANKGRWLEGQYVLVFMNGCDTYAYVDTALADAHAAVNPNQESDYQYLDILMNAMPAYFHENANNAMAVIDALMSYEAPLTYEQMFERIDPSQVVLVSGEQDNTFVPGGGGGEGTEDWEGLEAQGEVQAKEELRWETPVLAAGSYLFELDGNGDADLYVRIGEAPSTERWDCRPYRYGSREQCVVELPAAAPVHVMVRGWDEFSEFTLRGAAQ